MNQGVPSNSVSELRDVTNAPPSSVAPAIPAYDFRRPSKLSREHIRMLQSAYETFARRTTTLLTSGLRAVCQVSIVDIIQQSYEEYVTGLATPTLMAPMTVPPLAGTGVLEFSLPVALTSIDHMLGGPGGSQPPRTLTDIETTLIRGLIDQIVGVFRYAFEPISAINPAVGPIEYNPQFIQAASATDSVIVAVFDMAVGSESCRATLCLPLAPLLPIMMAQRGREEIVGEDARLAAEATARRLRERLGDVPVDVTVLFDPATVSPATILSLAKGDVLPLTHRVGAPLTLTAGGVKFAKAIAGKSGKHLAALIVDTPKEHA
jgi:flagellar motor switch protein FliM